MSRGASAVGPRDGRGARICARTRRQRARRLEVAHTLATELGLVQAIDAVTCAVRHSHSRAPLREGWGCFDVFSCVRQDILGERGKGVGSSALLIPQSVARHALQTPQDVHRFRLESYEDMARRREGQGRECERQDGSSRAHPACRYCLRVVPGVGYARVRRVALLMSPSTPAAGHAPTT